MLEIWQAEFDWMDANVDGGVLTFTLHPQVIGRGSRIAMLDALIRHCGEAERTLRDGSATSPRELDPLRDG